MQTQAETGIEYAPNSELFIFLAQLSFLNWICFPCSITLRIGPPMLCI